METGAELKLNPANIKAQFIQQMKSRFNEIRLRCMQFKIDFFSADINRDYEQVLLSFLEKRSKLY